MLDTGAEVSLIKAEALDKMPCEKIVRSDQEAPIITDVNDRTIPTYGKYVVTVKILGEEIKIPIIKVSNKINFASEILLGMDAIALNEMQLDFKQNKLKIKGKFKGFETNPEESQWRQYVRAIKVPKYHRKAPMRVRVLFDQEIAPKSTAIIHVRITNGRDDNFLFTPHAHYMSMMSEGLIETNEKGYAKINVENAQTTRIFIKKKLALGVANEIEVRELDQKCFKSRINQVGTKELKEVIEEITPHVKCNEAEKVELVELLAKYRDVIALPGEPLGRTHLAELSLKLIEGTRPIALAPYKIPHSKEGKLNEEIDKLLAQGSVRPTVSPWSFPVVLVNKPDGSVRLCVDYRKLNAVTEADSYPLPVIDDLIMDLGDAKVFSQIDLVQAYHQVPLAEDTRPLTAFRTKSHHLEYVVSPFGLKQMPAVFQRLMNRIFNVDPTRKYVSAYLDDLLVHSEIRQDHLKHLEDVLNKLRLAGLKIKLSKCNFFEKEVKYLGYSITDDGFKPQEEKVLAIEKFDTPTSVDGIRSFLGMAGYYRAYIPQFSVTAKPMTELLKKEKEFVWTDECEIAFNKLKSCLSSAPVLAYPDFKRPFVLETDASGYGIGAVLCQEDPNVRNRLRPISYTSRLLKGPEINYSVTEKEALAVIHALKKFKFIVYGYETTVNTDHKPLVSLFANTLPPGRLGRWALLVQAYDVKFKYKPGILNKVSDCLSRYPLPDRSDDPVTDVGTIQCVQEKRRISRQPKAAWSVEGLIQAQRSDTIFGPIYKYCNSDKTEKPPPTPRGLPLSDFKVAGDVLHFEDKGKELREGQNRVRVVVPQELVNTLLRLYHDMPSAGHRGVESTVDRIEAKYVVLALRHQVKEYVENCEACAQFRTHPRPHTPKYQYQVLPVPFNQVHMDIMGPLPLSTEGNRYIIVYVDRFTRYTIVDALPDKSTTTVARSLFNRVVAEYTSPKILVSDNALEFTSQVIQDLCALLKITKAEITAYTPAANGLAESANKRILNVLRTAVNPSQKNWDQMLPHVQVAVNTAYHAAIGDTPHYLLFLQDKIMPFEFDLAEPAESSGDYVETMASRQRKAIMAAQENLMEEEAKVRKKKNRGAKEYPVKEGYRVYLKSRAKNQRGFGKLSPKWEGPYRVMSDLGRQRYLVKNLSTGKERKVHADHTKIVPETCCTKLMNHRVRTPHPRLVPPDPQTSVSCEFDDDELIMVSQQADSATRLPDSRKPGSPSDDNDAGPDSRQLGGASDDEETGPDHDTAPPGDERRDETLRNEVRSNQGPYNLRKNPKRRQL